MKLLNKSTGLYTVYATVLLLLAIPFVYFAIQHRIIHEMDESLAEQKNTLISKWQNASGESLLPWLQNIGPDVTLTPMPAITTTADRFYTITSYDKASHENNPYRILETAVTLFGRPYQLLIKNSLLDTNDLIESIAKTMALFLLLIIAGLVLISQLLSKRLWKPFYNTIGKLNNFKIEEKAPLHFDDTSIAEFRHLNESIVKLTGRSKEVYQSQKEFTENAAHELQTPLAVFQGKLDLLMQTEPISKEQSELIAGLEDVNQHMKKLHKALLLLTRIENNQFAGTEQVSVKEVIEKLAGQYSFAAAQKEVGIVQKSNSALVVNANRVLLEIMLGNLLGNAIKHNVHNGFVHICMEGNTITFTNPSSIAALNELKLFERFYSQPATGNGLGLGLQIAKKIADTNHFKVAYSFKDGQHFFSVLF